MDPNGRRIRFHRLVAVSHPHGSPGRALVRMRDRLERQLSALGWDNSLVISFAIPVDMKKSRVPQNRFL